MIYISISMYYGCLFNVIESLLKTIDKLVFCSYLNNTSFYCFLEANDIVSLLRTYKTIIYRKKKFLFER